MQVTMTNNADECLQELAVETVKVKKAQVGVIKKAAVSSLRRIIFTLASRPGKSPQRPSPHVVTAAGQVAQGSGIVRQEDDRRRKEADCRQGAGHRAAASHDV
jgi:hypothetical protein